MGCTKNFLKRVGPCIANARFSGLRKLLNTLGAIPTKLPLATTVLKKYRKWQCHLFCKRLPVWGKNASGYTVRQRVYQAVRTAHTPERFHKDTPLWDFKQFGKEKGNPGSAGTVRPPCAAPKAGTSAPPMPGMPQRAIAYAADLYGT